jgi:hypothetical protein
VHSAGIQDSDGAKAVLAQAKVKYPTIVKFFADGGYAGALQIWCFLTLKTLLAIAHKIVDIGKTYAILGSKYSKDGDRSCCCI